MERIEPLANFLNTCLDYHIKVVPTSTRKGRIPWYLRTNIYIRGAQEWIVHLLRKRTDTMIVGMDLRYPPMYMLENLLVDDGMECYKTNKKPINNSIANDKVLITTLDALSPSDTRNIVVVMTNGMTTTQELFRACSRATEWLIIVDDAQTPKDSLPLTLSSNYVRDVNERASGTFNTKTQKDKPTILLPNYTTEVLVEASVPINVPIIANNNFVADITGVAIPIIYEWRTTGKIKIIDKILESPKCLLQHKRFLHFADFDKIEDILKLSNLYLYIIQGYKSRYETFRVEMYSWLDTELVNLLIGRMNKHISPTNSIYELPFGADVIDNDSNTLWEIKCKKRIETKDIEQLVRYAVLDNKSHSYKLLNLFTEEVIMVNVD